MSIQDTINQADSVLAKTEVWTASDITTLNKGIALKKVIEAMEQCKQLLDSNELAELAGLLA